jgi:hypothetical protein
MEAFNMKSTYDITYPEQTTYFIAYTSKEIFAYGIVEPNQEMTTGQPILWTTLSEAEWLYKLETEFNTFPDETN